LTIWVNGARCTVNEAMHLSECTGDESTSITVAAQRFMDYKYLIRLALIAISHPIFLIILGFFPLALC
jgi:hypothetical protein